MKERLEEVPSTNLRSDDKAEDHISAPPHQRASAPPGEWTLTREAFDKLLSHLGADREQAGQKYELIRRKLTKFFEWRGCVAPEDYTDEAINRVARKIEEGAKIDNLNAFFYGVARMLLMEEGRAREKERLARERLPPSLHPGENPEEPDARLACFERCLSELPAASRELVIAYYQEERRARIENRRALAERMGIPPNALRIRAHRIRVRLEECVNQCLNRLPDRMK